MLDLDKLFTSKKAKEALDDLAIDAICSKPGCGNKVKFKFSEDLLCFDCNREREIRYGQQKKTGRVSSLVGTDYEGKWWPIYGGTVNAKAANEVRELMIPGSKANVIVYGMNPGTGKTQAAMFVRESWLRSGRSVVIESLKMIHTYSTADESIPMLKKYSEADLLIIEEAGKPRGYTANDKGYVFDIIENRIRYQRAIMITGNLCGIERPEDNRESKEYYASDSFNLSRLTGDFEAFEFGGKDFRKEKRR